MGCSVLCKVSKEEEVIKTEVKKDLLENDQPIIQNIEKVETQKNIEKEKNIEINNEPKKIVLSINKVNTSEKNQILLSQTIKTNKDQKLTNFTSKIQDLQNIKEN